MNATDPLAAWTDNLQMRPEVFPHRLNLVNDSLLLVELSAEEVASASFLDQRVLQSTTKGTWIAWQPVGDIFGPAVKGGRASFIFHVGHCGSTLMSRLLQMLGDTQSLREPLPLRTLAQDLADAGDGRSFLAPDDLQKRLQVLSKMWCRGAPHTVIKATSICTDLLPVLHAATAGTRSIFVFNRAETHIATLLAGENALTDLKGFAQLRLQRLRQATGLELQLHQLNLAQLAGLSWLSETTSATHSLEAHAGQVLSLEFESFISHPAESLNDIARFLDIPTHDAEIENAVGSDVLQTYSKAPEHRYNAETRAAILTNSRSTFGKEIHEAMAWIDELAARSDLIAASMKHFA